MRHGRESPRDPRPPERRLPDRPRPRPAAAVRRPGDVVGHRRRTGAGVQSRAARQHPRPHLRPDRRGRRVSFGTYFNAFPASYWQHWTAVRQVTLTVRTDGPGDDSRLPIERLGRTPAHRDARGRRRGDVELRPGPRPVQRRRVHLVRHRRRREERASSRAPSGRPSRSRPAPARRRSASRPSTSRTTASGRCMNLADSPDVLELVDRIFLVDQGDRRVDAPAGVRRRGRGARRDAADHHPAEPRRIGRIRARDGRDARSPRERLRPAARRRRAPRARVRAPFDRVRSLRDDADDRRRAHVRPARPPEAARVGRGRRRRAVHVAGALPGEASRTTSASRTCASRRCCTCDWTPTTTAGGCASSRSRSSARSGSRCRRSSSGTTPSSACARATPATPRCRCPAWRSGTCRGSARTTRSTGRRTSTPAIASSPRCCTPALPRGGTLLRHSRRVDLKHLMMMQYYPVALRHRALRDILSGPEHMRAQPRDRDAGGASARRRVPRDRRSTRTPACRCGRVAAARCSSGLSRARPRQPDRASPALVHALARWSRTGSTRRAPENLAQPEVEFGKGDAHWWRLPVYDSALVSAADGSGKNIYTRDRTKFRRMLRGQHPPAPAAATRVAEARSRSTALRQPELTSLDVMAADVRGGRRELDRRPMHRQLSTPRPRRSRSSPTTVRPCSRDCSRASS